MCYIFTKYKSIWKKLQPISGRHHPNFNKDWAIAYDRVICLVDGQYEIYAQTLATNTNIVNIFRNGVIIAGSHGPTTDSGHSTNVKLSLERGDYIQVKGDWYQNQSYNNFTITRL